MVESSKKLVKCLNQLLCRNLGGQCCKSFDISKQDTAGKKHTGESGGRVVKDDLCFQAIN